MIYQSRFAIAFDTVFGVSGRPSDFRKSLIFKEKKMSKDVQQFLEFRKKFTKREWHELNRAVEVRLNEKADQLELDDFDLKVITERLERYL